MIILNEKEYAKNCIKENTLGDNIYRTILLIARYYYQCCGYKKKQIVSELKNFMALNYKFYKSEIIKWEEVIDDIVNKHLKIKLVEANDVIITESEMEYIDKLATKNLRKLAFTYLCLAKFHNKVNEKSNSWVTEECKDIFKMADIRIKSIDQQIMIGELVSLGYLDYAKKNTNLNKRVCVMDNESKPVLVVSDFRHLGYEYLKYKGESYERCAECGALFKQNKNKTKMYCSQCSAYSPVETKVIECIDCGKKIRIKALNTKTRRCETCQSEYVKQYDRNRKRKNNAK